MGVEVLVGVIVGVSVGVGVIDEVGLGVPEIVGVGVKVGAESQIYIFFPHNNLNAKPGAISIVSPPVETPVTT